MGLVNRPQLNGVRGTIMRHIPAKDRWEVELNDGHGKVSLKALNMRLELELPQRSQLK